MKSLDHLDQWRQLDGQMGSRHGDQFGAFYIQRGSTTIICIASPGGPECAWDHVSARIVQANGAGRCPTWAEMCWLKDQFFEPEDCVVQYHPPRSAYVNHHPHVLHLWKPTGVDLPRPPNWAV